MSSASPVPEIANDVSSSSTSHANEDSQEDSLSSFISNVLKPGSSLHPTFLLIVDGAFAFLFCIFIILAFITSGNIHIFGLMAVELCLWASVKWFVNELKQLQNERSAVEQDVQDKEE